MKKSLFILTLICLLCSTLAITACKDSIDISSLNHNSNSSSNSSESNYIPEISSSSSSEKPFSLKINIENYTIDQNKISFEVPEKIYSYSFVNSFTIPSNYKWELHWDKECLSSLNIVSKTVDLENGTNVLYALFINKNDFDDVHLYTIVVERDYMTQEEWLQQQRADAITLAETYAEKLYENKQSVDPYSLIYYLNTNGYDYHIGYYAVKNCNTDWYKHAKRITQEYLNEISIESTVDIDREIAYIENSLLLGFTDDIINQDVIKQIVSNIDWTTLTIA